MLLRGGISLAITEPRHGKRIAALTWVAGRRVVSGLGVIVLQGVKRAG